MNIYAQRDFESWNATEFNLNLTKKTNIFLTTEARLNNNSTEIRKFLTDLGIEQRLAKRITFTCSYRYSKAWERIAYHNEHVFFSIIKYSYRIQRFNVAGQFRSQYNTQHFKKNIVDENIYLRPKITISYRWPTMPLTLYSSYENFIQMYPYHFIENYRVLAGFRYRINRMHTINIFTGLTQDYGSTSYRTIIGIKYTYSLNLQKSRTKTETDE